MQTVITTQQARLITKGRTPLVPVEYETAVKALVACTQIDEAKYWDAKADALAAWAKIYRSNETIMKAKQLKLHAYRRMGQLAAELRPDTGPKRGNSGAGRLPGAPQLLQDHGMKRSEASACRRLALLPERKFNQILKNPAAPTTIAHKLWASDPEWKDFTHRAMTFRTFCRSHKPSDIAELCRRKDGYYLTAHELATEISEWVEELLDRLPKGKKAA